MPRRRCKSVPPAESSTQGTSLSEDSGRLSVPPLAHSTDTLGESLEEYSMEESSDVMPQSTASTHQTTPMPSSSSSSLTNGRLEESGPSAATASIVRPVAMARKKKYLTMRDLFPDAKGLPRKMDRLLALDRLLLAKEYTFPATDIDVSRRSIVRLSKSRMFVGELGPLVAAESAERSGKNCLQQTREGRICAPAGQE